MIEEEIFYPAFRGKIEDDLLDEAYVEHDGAKVLINDIEAGGPDEQFYDAKVKVLSEEIEHHVEEEEKPAEGMFAQCRKTDVDLVALRDAMLGAQGRADGAGRSRQPAAGEADGGRSGPGLIPRGTATRSCPPSLLWNWRNGTVDEQLSRAACFTPAPVAEPARDLLPRPFRSRPPSSLTTLAEDLGDDGDITSAAVIPAEARFTGVMDSARGDRRGRPADRRGLLPGARSRGYDRAAGAGRGGSRGRARICFACPARRGPCSPPSGRRSISSSISPASPR